MSVDSGKFAGKDWIKLRDEVLRNKQAGIKVSETLSRHEISPSAYFYHVNKLGKKKVVKTTKGNGKFHRFVAEDSLSGIEIKLPSGIVLSVKNGEALKEVLEAIKE